MLGGDLLVALVYNSTGELAVYLPEGRWVDYWTHAVVAGPRTVAVRAPLEQIPLYVRSGAILPTVDPGLSIPDGSFGPLTFEAYLIDRGECIVRDLDREIRVSAQAYSGTLRVEARGTRPGDTLRVVPLDSAEPIERVVVNGREEEWKGAVEL